ncbi:hypothetical protein SADUNF_Sadunf12G0040200 [Salix dunnii]|uniref:non-specific serine/threonine protein kinase n=1 Tax=Salix dunnii TaxID=1413687 RepID=A0A835JMX6_9ROSI|nr:hypothetical protein SADUNF_Sadunf12G0040200 [Salix dunnii]
MVAHLLLLLYQHHPITTVFFVLILLSTSYGENDNKEYTACKKNFSCGNFSDLSYPFWGGDRPEFCGHKGFKLKCVEGQFPIIASEELEFRLYHLDQPSRLMTLQLENPTDYICPAKNLTNSSTTSDIHVFGYDLNLQNLNLLYNCTVSNSTREQNRISNCGGSNCTVSDSTMEQKRISNCGGSSFYGSDEFLEISSWLNETQCNLIIKIPIPAASFNRLTGDRADLERVLAEKFNVSYKYDQGPSICDACMASKGICGTNMTDPNREFLCLCRDHPYSFVCKGNSWNVGRKVRIVTEKANILVPAVGASLATFIIMFIAFFFWYRHKKRQYVLFVSRSIKSAPSSMENMEKLSRYNGVHLFSYEELEEATNNFDETRELGDGGFGTVYYGKLPDGREVAVKRLYESNYKRLEQFLNEVDIITRLHHQNLVLLHRHEINLSTMAINKIQSNALNELVDPSLGFESDYATRKMICAVAELAFQCLQSAKELRPSMEKVVEILKDIQSRDYGAEKAEVIEIPSDDVALLKSGPIQP